MLTTLELLLLNALMAQVKSSALWLPILSWVMSDVVGGIKLSKEVSLFGEE